MRRSAAWVGVVVLGCSATPAQDALDRADGAAPVVLTGRVVASGDSVAGPKLYLESGHAVSVGGELAPEIARLAGARLTVVGYPLSDESVRARSYAILEVNGERPQVGVVARRDGAYALFLESGAIGLDSVGRAPLATLLGAKIWAIGLLQGETLRIESYGVIRPK